MDPVKFEERFGLSTPTMSSEAFEARFGVSQMQPAAVAQPQVQPLPPTPEQGPPQPAWGYGDMPVPDAGIMPPPQPVRWEPPAQPTEDSDGGIMNLGRMEDSVLPEGRGPIAYAAERLARGIWSPEGTLAQQGQERGVIGATAAGLYQGGQRGMSVVQRSQGEGDAANKMLDNVNKYEQALQQGDEGVQGFLAQTYRGALSSLVTSTSGGMVGGAPGAILFASASEMNSAINEGQKAGLSGEDLQNYVIRAGLIEAAPAAFMQAVGMGGMETIIGKLRKTGVDKSVAEVSSRGIMAALKQLGVSTLQEVPEELVTEISHNINTALTGVDPKAITKEQLLDTSFKTTSQVFLTMGLVNARNIARGTGQTIADQKRARNITLGTRELDALRNTPIDVHLKRAFGEDSVMVREDGGYNVITSTGDTIQVVVKPVPKPTTPELQANYLDSIQNEHKGEKAVEDILKQDIPTQAKVDALWELHPISGGFRLPNGQETTLDSFLAGVVELSDDKGFALAHELNHGILRSFTTPQEFETLVRPFVETGAFSEEGVVNRALFQGAMESGMWNAKGIEGIFNRAVMRARRFTERFTGESFGTLAQRIHDAQARGKGNILKRGAVADAQERHRLLRELSGQAPVKQAPPQPGLTDMSMDAMLDPDVAPPAGGLEVGPDIDPMAAMQQAQRDVAPVPEPVTQEVTPQEPAWNDYAGMNRAQVVAQAKERGVPTNKKTPDLIAELEDMNRRGVGAVEQIQDLDENLQAFKKEVRLGGIKPFIDRRDSLRVKSGAAGPKMEDMGVPLTRRGLPKGLRGIMRNNGVMRADQWINDVAAPMGLLPYDAEPGELFQLLLKPHVHNKTREYSLQEYLASKHPEMQDTAAGKPSEEMTDAERQAFDDDEYIPFSTLSAEDGAVVDYLVQQAGGDPVRAWQDYERTLTAAAQRGEPVDQRKADMIRRVLLYNGEQSDMFGEAAPEKERRSRFVTPPERPVQQSLEGMDDGMLFSTKEEGKQESFVGKRFREIADRIEADSSPDNLLVPKGSEASKKRVAAQTYKDMPKNIVAFDGENVLLHNPEKGSLLNRLLHLVTYGDRKSVDNQKMQWLPLVPETLQNAHVKLKDDDTGNHVYMRRYEDTFHAVVVDPRGATVGTEVYDAALKTQFPDNEFSRRGNMSVIRERYGLRNPVAESVPDLSDVNGAQPSHQANQSIPQPPQDVKGGDRFSTLSPVTAIQREVAESGVSEQVFQTKFYQEAYKRANPAQMKRLDKWLKSQPEDIQEYLERQKRIALRDKQLEEAVASSGRSSFESAITGKKGNRYFDRPRPDDWKERSHYRPGIPEVDQARADFQEANRKATELRKKWDTHARAEETVREPSGPSERMLAELRKQEFIENEAHNKYMNALMDNGMRYSTATVEAIEQRLRDQYGVDITLFDNQIGDIRIQHIAVQPDKRKQGVGSSVMRDLTAYADTHSKRLVLQTGVQDRFSGTTSAARLKRFYKRFGFVENKGRNKDYRISENMIRNPKTESIDAPQFSTLDSYPVEYSLDDRKFPTYNEPIPIPPGIQNPEQYDRAARQNAEDMKGNFRVEKVPSLSPGKPWIVRKNPGDRRARLEVTESALTALEKRGGFKTAQEAQSYIDQHEGTMYSTASREISPGDYPDSLSKIVAHTSVNYLKTRPDYRVAKGIEKPANTTITPYQRGEAAERVVHGIVKQKAVDELKALLDPNKPIVFVPVLGREVTSVNGLPTLYAEYLAREIGGTVWYDIGKIEGAANTGVSIQERNHNVQRFDGTIPPSNAQIVIVDDTSTSGDTFASLIDFLASNGNMPTASTVLARGMQGLNLKPTEVAIQKLLDKARMTDVEFEHEFGYPTKHLTGQEIQSYILKGRKGDIRPFFPSRRSTGDRTGGQSGDGSPGSPNQITETSHDTLSNDAQNPESRYSTAMSREPIPGVTYAPPGMDNKTTSDIIRTTTRHFGITNDPREAGYIRPDGKMLDLSGKKEGGSSGVRQIDHRDLPDIGSKDRNENMLFAKNAGLARVDLSQGMLNITRPLTPQQKSVILRQMEQAQPDYITFEVDNPQTHNTVYAADMDGRDIKAFRRALNEAEAVMRGERAPERVSFPDMDSDTLYSTVNLDSLSDPQRQRYQDAAFTAMYQHAGAPDAFKATMTEQFGDKIEPYLEDLQKVYVRRRREATQRAQLAAMQQKPVGRPDLANFGETPEAKQMLNQVDEARNQTGKPDSVPRDETLAKAEDMITKDRDGTIAHLRARGEQGTPLDAVETRAATILYNDLAKQAAESGRQDDYITAFEFADAIRDARSEWGRAGIEMQMPKTPEQKRNVLRDYLMSPSYALQDQVQNLNKRLKHPTISKGARDAANRKLTDIRTKQAKQVAKRVKWMERLGWDLSDAGLDAIITDNKLLPRFMADVSTDRSSMFDKMHELRISNMLSWVTTHQRNVLSSQGHFMWETYFQRAVEASVNLFMQESDAAQWGEFGQIMKQTVKALPGGPIFRTAMQNARQAWATEQQQLFGQVTGEHAFSTPRLDSYRGPAIKGAKGRAIRSPLRALMFEDELQRTIFASIEVGAQAYRMAKAEGKQGKERQARIQELMDNPMSDAWKEAYNQATRHMFQDTTGTGAEEGIMNLRSKLPGGRWLVPFARTPMSLYRSTLRKAGGAAVALPFDYATGQSGNVKVRHAAEALIAVVGTAALYGMLIGDDDDEPLITGANPPNASNNPYSTESYEIPRNSAKVGDGYFDYRSIEPLGGIISMLVTGLEGLRDVRNGEEFADAALKTWGLYTREFSRHPMLTGFSDFMDAMQSEDRWMRFAQNFVGSFSPNAVKGVLRSADETVRDRRGMTTAEGFQHALYPSGERQPAKVDVWGREVDKGGTATSRALSPYRRVKNIDNPNSIEGRLNTLIRKWNTANPDDQFRPQGPSRWITHNGKRIELTPDQYEEYRKRAGRYAIETLKNTRLKFDNPSERDKEFVRRALDQGRDRARAEMIRLFLSDTKSDTKKRTN